MTQTRLNILDQKPALSTKSKPVSEKPLLVAPAATSLSRFFPSFSAKLAASFPAESSPTGSSTTPFQNLFSLVPPSSASRQAREIDNKNCAISAANLSLSAMTKHHFPMTDVESPCDEPPTCCKYTLCNATELGHMKPNRHSCPLSLSVCFLFAPNLSR